VAETKPGIVPLRPLGLGEILDGAFTLIRRYPRVTLGLSALIAVINGLLRLVIDFGLGNVPDFNPTGDDTGTGFQDSSGVFTIAGLLDLIVAAILSFVLVGMMTVVVGEAILGRPITARETWRRIYPRFFGLVLVSFLAAVLPYLGLIGLIVFGVFLWGKLALAVPAFVLEKIGPGQALRRSWRLVQGSFWRVWGIRALAAIIVGFMNTILAVPFFIGAIASTGIFSGDEPSGTPVLFVVLITLGSVVGQTITTPLMAAILVLLYVDQRMRKEALDVALVASVGGTPALGGTTIGPPRHTGPS
jgi:hypothetical protein